MVREVVLAGGRSLTVCSPGEVVSVSAPFSTLMPAFSTAERSDMEALVAPMLAMGCAEFCCVGPEAELLHDALDYVIEEQGALHVLTTGFSDVNEAVDYLLFAAGGGTHSLLALTPAHPDLSALLLQRALCFVPPTAGAP